MVETIDELCKQYENTLDDQTKEELKGELIKKINKALIEDYKGNMPKLEQHKTVYAAYAKYYAKLYLIYDRKPHSKLKWWGTMI